MSSVQFAGQQCCSPLTVGTRVLSMPTVVDSLCMISLFGSDVKNAWTMVACELYTKMDSVRESILRTNELNSSDTMLEGSSLHVPLLHARVTVNQHLQLKYYFTLHRYLFIVA